MFTGYNINTEILLSIFVLLKKCFFLSEFQYVDIKDLINNIKNDTISEIDGRKDLNTLDKIKNAEIIKYKKRTPGHKELFNLFNDLLDIFLTDKILES